MLVIAWPRLRVFASFIIFSCSASALVRAVEVTSKIKGAAFVWGPGKQNKGVKFIFQSQSFPYIILMLVWDYKKLADEVHGVTLTPIPRGI